MSLLDYKHHPGVGGLRFTQQYGNAWSPRTSQKRAAAEEHSGEVREIWTGPIRKGGCRMVHAWTLGYEEVSSALIGFESAAQVDEYLADIASFSAGTPASGEAAGLEGQRRLRCPQFIRVRLPLLHACEIALTRRVLSSCITTLCFSRTTGCRSSCTGWKAIRTWTA
jgi:hypothetical protein